MNNQTVRWVLIGLLVVGGIYLVIDHGQHLAPYLPYAFILGMLAMHLFGHGGHSGHDGHNHEGHEQPKK